MFPLFNKFMFVIICYLFFTSCGHIDGVVEDNRKQTEPYVSLDSPPTQGVLSTPKDNPTKFDLKNISYGYTKDELLRQSISMAIENSSDLDIDMLDISEYPIYRFYEGNLDYMPDGFNKNICLVNYVESINNYRLYLFAISPSYDRALLLSYMDIDFIFNDAKMDISFEEDNIRVWSQMPFSAAEVNAMLNWDGNNLKLVETKYNDPSQNALDEQRKLLESKDIDGLLAFEDDIFYPLRYPDFLELPKPILSFAHKEALKEYKNGNLLRALEIMEYGLKLYTNRHILPNPDSENDYSENDFQEQGANLFTKNEFMALINDYAFFIYKNNDRQKSLKLLLNVEKLYPERIVVYINLGDLYWEEGEQVKGISYYKKYKELLNDDNKLPERVILRLNNTSQ